MKTFVLIVLSFNVVAWLLVPIPSVYFLIRHYLYREGITEGTFPIWISMLIGTVMIVGLISGIWMIATG